MAIAQLEVDRFSEFGSEWVNKGGKGNVVDHFCNSLDFVAAGRC
jgi:hypothetical protein